MCGFFISNDSLHVENAEGIIARAVDFRGPDFSSGLISNNGWKSYHARLSIIDITTSADQPVINADGSQLVFNGEILNYYELGLKHFSREYSSDTLLLNDLVRFGKLKLAELDGFFAFVFIDGQGVLRHAARDRFGVKPLFFYENNGSLSFCSEPSALNRLFSLDVNKHAVEEYKVFRCPLFQESFFSGVKAVPPGSCMVSGEYFNLQTELDVPQSDALSHVTLEQKLRAGISSRLVSDVPVGLLLSRGVDSNLLRTFGVFDTLYSIGFSGDEDFEFLKNADFSNLILKEANTNEFEEAFEYLLNLRGEPMSVPNEVLLFLISRRARQDGVKVLLSGEGADEFFGGYDRVFSWAASTNEFSVKEFLQLYAYGEVQSGTRIFNLVSKVFQQCKLRSAFDKVRWFFIKYHMPVLFRRLDFALMAAGVEGREPIANMHLFDVCKYMTSDDLMVDGLGKRPLRDLLNRELASGLAYEPKVGFPVDLTLIFDNPRNLSSYELWFEKNLEVLL